MYCLDSVSIVCVEIVGLEYLRAISSIWRTLSLT